MSKTTAIWPLGQFVAKNIAVLIYSQVRMNIVVVRKNLNSNDKKKYHELLPENNAFDAKTLEDLSGCEKKRMEN